MKQLVSQKRIGVTVVSTLLLAILSCSSFPISAEQTGVEAESAKTWVGKKAQPFTLPGLNGKTVNIAENLSKRPVVLVFYRGVWRPFCHTQLGQLGKIDAELKTAGAIVYAISNEEPSDLKKMKDIEKLGDSFVFLSDPKATAADIYAGHYDGKTILKPATFVIGKNGKIAYAYVGEDFKVRATAQAVLEAIKKDRH